MKEYKGVFFKRPFFNDFLTFYFSEYCIIVQGYARIWWRQLLVLRPEMDSMELVNMSRYSVYLLTPNGYDFIAARSR